MFSWPHFNYCSLNNRVKNVKEIRFKNACTVRFSNKGPLPLLEGSSFVRIYTWLRPAQANTFFGSVINETIQNAGDVPLSQYSHLKYFLLSLFVSSGP